MRDSKFVDVVSRGSMASRAWRGIKQEMDRDLGRRFRTPKTWSVSVELLDGAIDGPIPGAVDDDLRAARGMLRKLAQSESKAMVRSRAEALVATISIILKEPGSAREPIESAMVDLELACSLDSPMDDAPWENFDERMARRRRLGDEILALHSQFIDPPIPGLGDDWIGSDA